MYVSKFKLGLNTLLSLLEEFVPYSLYVDINISRHTDRLYPFARVELLTALEKVYNADLNKAFATQNGLIKKCAFCFCTMNITLKGN